MFWLHGYLDGLRALGALDQRLASLAKVDFGQVSTLVLVYCTKKPNQTVGEATTNVLSLTINLMGPGANGPIELTPPSGE